MLFRVRDDVLEVLLGHMGGPFWVRKDDGAWSIPKGELLDDEQPLVAARREFEEELGHPPPDCTAVLELGEVRQGSGKRVIAFAIEGDFDPATIQPGTFEMQWPPRSGRVQSFPEIDRVAWFDVAAAGVKIVQGQAPLLDRLVQARARFARPTAARLTPLSDSHERPTPRCTPPAGMP